MLFLVGFGRRVEGEGLKRTVHVWCLSCHPRHLMLLSPPTLFNNFYKCAKLCGLCQKSSVTGTSINQVGSPATSELCH